jgi:hypothetical protein
VTNIFIYLFEGTNCAMNTDCLWSMKPISKHTASRRTFTHHLQRKFIFCLIMDEKPLSLIACMSNIVPVRRWQQVPNGEPR